MGHYVRNCPRRKKQERINLIDYDDGESINIPTAPIPRDNVASVKQQLTNMTPKK